MCVSLQCSQSRMLCCIVKGLLEVRAEIIKHWVCDRGSWQWEQTDVAIIKKYTIFELNMKRLKQDEGKPETTQSSSHLANRKSLPGVLTWVHAAIGLNRSNCFRGEESGE